MQSNWLDILSELIGLKVEISNHKSGKHDSSANKTFKAHFLNKPSPDSLRNVLNAGGAGQLALPIVIVILPTSVINKDYLYNM